MSPTDSLTDATIMLTGASTGIGAATARVLARTAGRLVLQGLEPENQVEDMLLALRSSMRPGTELAYFSADYGDLEQVAGLAERVRASVDRIDLLINNAARPGAPVRTVDQHGVEVTFRTNYLATVLLTSRLIDMVGDGGPGRIVNVASATHYSATLDLDDLSFAHRRYAPSEAYAHSKLALVAYSCRLAAHRPRPTIDIVSMHPGVIATSLLHAMFAIAGDRPERAAANLLHVAMQGNDNGAYYDERVPAEPNRQASDPAIQDRLWQATHRLLGDYLKD